MTYPTDEIETRGFPMQTESGAEIGDWVNYTDEELIEVLDGDDFEREVAKRLRKFISYRAFWRGEELSELSRPKLFFSVGNEEFVRVNDVIEARTFENDVVHEVDAK